MCTVLVSPGYLLPSAVVTSSSPVAVSAALQGEYTRPCDWTYTVRR
jgi:hypothetical protein